MTPSWIGEILTAPPAAPASSSSSPVDRRGLTGPALSDPLSQGEIRVLRYLPTELSAPQIAGQLYLSVNTVKTHMRHSYDKLGAHQRYEAVEQARALALLAPGPRRR